MTSDEQSRVPPLSRRALLMGGAGAVVATGVGAALWSSDGADGRNGADVARGPSVPAQNYPEFEEGQFVAKNRGGAQAQWSVQRPAGVRSVLHPVIVLHDEKGNHSAPFRDLQLAEALSTAVSTGVTPFALCAVDAQAQDGSDSFYHPRAAQGKTLDAGKMVLEEFIPLLAGKGLDVSKIAFWGWGMGGYGALRLGAIYEQERPGSVVGIVATSPALGVRNPPEAGAFDSFADYQQNSVANYVDTLRKLPLRIDSGTSGRYVEGAEALADQLAPTKNQGKFSAGGSEDTSFLKSIVPDELAFLGSCFSAR